MDERQEIAPPAPGRDKGLVAALVVLALAGAWISLMLTSVHLASAGGRPAVFRLLCRARGGGCDQVLDSPWATLPGHVPVAAAGLAYFGALAVWYLVVGGADRSGRAWHFPVLLLHCLGGLASVLLIGIMITQVRAVCWWCALTHGINFALLWLAWRLWSREGRREGGPVWPPARLGLAGLLLMIAVAVLSIQRLGIAQLQGRVRAAQGELARFRGDGELMQHLVLRSRPVEIPVRPDDTVLGRDTAPHTVVVFSDFQCPGCRELAAFLESSVIPAYGDRLRLIYKHFPLDTGCNPRLPRTLHSSACEAAYAAEAAREIGGREGFLAMHRALFQQQPRLGERRWSEIAGRAGLDGARVAELVAGGSHRDRITQDVQLGYDLKLDETPSVFVDGRRLEDWSNLDLWKTLLAGPSDSAREERSPQGAPASP
jgi:protein-disulfide isomerase/uncharacterized membrane protein